MANKLIPVGISRTCPHFNGESPHSLVWVWVRGIPDFFNWVWGWVCGCTYPRYNIRPRLNY